MLPIQLQRAKFLLLMLRTLDLPTKVPGPATVHREAVAAVREIGPRLETKDRQVTVNTSTKIATPNHVSRRQDRQNLGSPNLGSPNPDSRNRGSRNLGSRNRDSPNPDSQNPDSQNHGSQNPDKQNPGTKTAPNPNLETTNTTTSQGHLGRLHMISVATNKVSPAMARARAAKGNPIRGKIMPADPTAAPVETARIVVVVRTIIIITITTAAELTTATNQTTIF